MNGGRKVGSTRALGHQLLVPQGMHMETIGSMTSASVVRTGYHQSINHWITNSFFLPFPGGYYLTSAYGALSLIKNFQEEQAARLLSSETRDTLRQWHKRRTTNRTIPSVDDFQVRGWLWRRPGPSATLLSGEAVLAHTAHTARAPEVPRCQIIRWKRDILKHPLTLLFHFSVFFELKKKNTCGFGPSFATLKKTKPD